MIIEINQTKETLNPSIPEQNHLIDQLSLLQPLYVFPVYGILFTPQGVLYLVCTSRDSALLDLFSSRYFKIIDNSASEHWVVNFNMKNDNLVHYNYDFSNFDYIGIDRIFSEGDFMVRYHQDEPEYLRYVKRMQALLEYEAGMN